MVPKKDTDPTPKAPEPAKEPAKEAKHKPTKSLDSAARTYTLEEIAKQNTEKSAWFVHDGKVYDATEYLADHPGGAESIVITAGQDATEEFDAIHSTKARGMLEKYYIGLSLIHI